MGIASLFSQTPIEEAAALLAAKKPEEALAKLEATPKESEWYFKARFLKARILTEQKKHEPKRLKFMPRRQPGCSIPSAKTAWQNR